MAAFQLPGSGMAGEAGTMPPPTAHGPASAPPQPQGHDEVAAIGQAFELLSARIALQAQQREAQAAAHREVMAGVAHDLRTPLTALHGHLEAAQALPALPPACAPHLAAALAQSNTLRRLTQQLFELALLQATQELPLREPFRLDELLSDTVLKFHPGSARPGVALLLPAAEPVCLEGDLHLIERALSNLIDNAVRHAPGSSPVRVSLQRDAAQVQVLVEDQGPGLPPDLARRLDAGQPVRDLLSQRPGGRSGGLGLAIAQRIAQLHGGSLRTVPGPPCGARLALALPLTAGPPLRAVPLG
jgi:signal transduction histidine kinase